MKDTDLFEPNKLTFGEIKELIDKFESWNGKKLESFCALIGIRVEGRNIKREVDWDYITLGFLKGELADGIREVDKFDLYNRYVVYCAGRGISPKSSHSLSVYLTKKLNIADIKCKKVEGQTKRFYVFKDKADEYLPNVEVEE